MKDWRDLAECYGMPLELFFTLGCANHAAVEACERCPVRVQCLDAELDVMRLGVRSDGYSGGLSARQRRLLIRGERVSAEAPDPGIGWAKLLRDAITLIYGAAMDADRASRDAQSQLMRGRRVNPSSGPRPKAAKLAS